MRLTKEWINDSDQVISAEATIPHQTNLSRMLKTRGLLLDLAQNLTPDIIIARKNRALEAIKPFMIDEEELDTDLSDEYSWTDGVAHALLTGWPMVSVEPFSPYAKNYQPGQFLAGDLKTEDQTGLNIWKMLMSLRSVFPTIDLVAMIDDENGVDPKTRGQEFVAEVVKKMFNEGCIRGDLYPGEDYILIKESEMRKIADSSWREMLEATDGEIVEDGEYLRYIPSADYIEEFSLHSKNRRKELRRQGIPLFHNGMPSCPLMDSFSYRKEFNYYYLHWIILPDFFKQQQDQTYSLLRVLDFVPQENYQNLYFPTEKDPDKVVSDITLSLAKSLIKAAEQIENPNPFVSFIPSETAENIYSQPYQEDLDGFREAYQFLKDYQFKKVLDISSGPNLYPLILWQDLLDNSQIIIKRNSQQEIYWLEGQVKSPEPYWQRFFELTKKKTIDLGTNELQLRYQLFGDLLEEEFDGISCFFGLENENYSRIPFQLKIRTIIDALKPGQPFVFTHMISNQEPTEKDIEEIYNNLNVDYQMTIIADSPRFNYLKAVFVSGQKKNLFSSDHVEKVTTTTTV